MGWNKMRQQAQLEKVGVSSRNKSMVEGSGGISNALEMLRQMANSS